MELESRSSQATSIKEAADFCRQSGYTDWQLVEFAQHLVARRMQYSYTNSFDLPARAFRRGKGYCWHQTSALLQILRRLGFQVRLVYATRNHVPDTIREGRLIKQHISGHVWCRVRLNGEERDVCPGNINNRPGLLHFQPLSEIRNWNGLVCLFAYCGSAIVNARRHKALQQLPLISSTNHSQGRTDC